MTQTDSALSANFAFLARYDGALVRVATQAERYFPDDPVTSLMKMRQFGELLAQQVAARAGVFIATDEPQAELLGRLRRDTAYPRDVIDLFHDLRRLGNDAVHKHRGDHTAALAALKVARQLAVWFHRTFGDRAFRSGPFQPPRTPPDPTISLREELARLRAEHLATQTAAEAPRLAAHEAERRANTEAGERAVWESLATETQAQMLSVQSELCRLQAASAAATPATLQRLTVVAASAAEAIDVDEQATRSLIDARLRARGWDADSHRLQHAAGARPVAGQSRAIAEWPTANGPADYALFVGLMCVGIVEAKRARRNVMAAVDQAGRYS